MYRTTTIGRFIEYKCIKCMYDSRGSPIIHYMVYKLYTYTSQNF